MGVQPVVMTELVPRHEQFETKSHKTLSYHILGEGNRQKGNPMKKKLLALLCATALSACCLTLAACSGSNGESGTDTSKFVGDWQMAALQTEGVTIAGNWSTVLGEEMSLTMTVNEDGTGTMAYNDESVDFKWTAAESGNGITVSPTDAEQVASGLSSILSGSDGSDSATAESLDLTYDDANQAVVLSAETDDAQASVYLTADGKLASMPAISAEGSEAIASADQLVGDWKLIGVNMMGITMYGDAESLAAMIGDTDMSMSLAEDGTGAMVGSDVTWTVGDDGATITAAGMNVPVTAQGDSIVTDLTSAYGIEMIMVYSK